jgi:hypothetical protein
MGESSDERTGICHRRAYCQSAPTAEAVENERVSNRVDELMQVFSFYRSFWD